LLHADILPQKLSRRNAMVILVGLSGVACTSTGTLSLARRNLSAMARSSPKIRQGYDYTVEPVRMFAK
jgi:hypothetical protein